MKFYKYSVKEVGGVQNQMISTRHERDFSDEWNINIWKAKHYF